MSERVVPNKNYYLLIGMIVAVVILTFSVVSIVNGIRNKKINSGYISKYVSQLRYDELENYLIEPAADTFIYLTYTGDEKIYDLETKMKKIINNYELQTNFIYVDVTKEMIEENFLSELNNKFSIDESIKKLPVILYYKDGVLVDIIQSDSSIFTIADFQKLLDNYEIAS